MQTAQYLIPSRYGDGISSTITPKKARLIWSFPPLTLKICAVLTLTVSFALNAPPEKP